MVYFLYIFAVLFAVYGILIAALNSGTYFFLIWFFLAAIFFLLGLSLRKNWLKRLRKSVKVTAVILTVVVLTGFIYCESKIVKGFALQGTPELDYIVVLGAQVQENGPSAVLRQRLDRAVAYLRENPQTKVIVSGGQGMNEPQSEAACMRDFLIEHEITHERIILEDQSRTTKENLENSKRFITENASIGIVTNNFHLSRALLIAQDLNYENVTGIAAKSTALYLPNNILRECLALLNYYISK